MEDKGQARMTRIPVRVVPLLVILLPCFISSSLAKTIRYRPGTLSIEVTDSFLARYDDISVADARQRCIANENCITFSYLSEATRFPATNVTAHLFPYADWHVSEDGGPLFVEDARFHSYVNVTREKDAVVGEVGGLIELLMKVEISEDSATADEEGKERGSRLRKIGSSKDNFDNAKASKERIKNRKLLLLESIVDIIYPKQHRLLAAPLVTPWALTLATSEDEAVEVREEALSVLVILADGKDALPSLIEHGVYPSMKNIIEMRAEGAEEWNTVSKKALDVISNMCIYRSVNAQLSRLGAHHFLRSLLSQPGFPGLQATLALTHFSNKDLSIGSLPKDKLDDMVKLMRNAIDGDVAFGNFWDLVPGPLSAIKYLVFHTEENWVYDRLLEAGLMEELLRVLESDCLDPTDTEAALEVLWALVRASERARHMVVMAEHSIHEAEARLTRYDKSSRLASGLVESATNFGVGAEL